MEEVAFRVVHVDGVLADIRPLFNALATAVLDRPVEVGETDIDEASRDGSLSFPLPPPHTIARLGKAGGLEPEEVEDVRDAIRDITDFWVSVPPATEVSWRPVPRTDVIFHVRRVQTRGEPVLLQTIKWLNKRGYKNPIVWCEEE